MINWFFQYKANKMINHEINISDIQNSKKILFCLFTRFGDTIIDLVIIKEFIEEYPDKDYLILCPKQMRPYVNEIIPNVRCMAINKRNLFELLKIDLVLKKWRPDIGFNPWSNGLDSCFFISYCKKFLFYKDFLKPQTINHYQVVRRYLNLKEKEWKIVNLVSKGNYKNILICPQSTDNERSILSDQLDKIISEVESDFDSPDITIASMRLEYLRDNVNSFVFKKNAISSQNFIKLVKGSDLIICADSAPLHIANALKKHVFAVFNSTKPEVVLNSGDKLTIYIG
jgi:ADP-heptose:LPS heptosyltransferase